MTRIFTQNCNNKNIYTSAACDIYNVCTTVVYTLHVWYTVYIFMYIVSGPIISGSRGIATFFNEQHSTYSTMCYTQNFTLNCILHCAVQHTLYSLVFIPQCAASHTVLSLYLDERRGVQEITSMRLRELPRPNAGIFLYSPTRVKVQTLSNL